jgi:glyoxylase-like metal-dependent hydrolase (beta-lactamase superfamily II)
MEIAKGVFTYRGRSGDRIRPGSGSVNVTLVRGDGLVMLDTGVARGGAFRELEMRVLADGLNLAEVTWVAHTHCHWDHINAAGIMQRRSGAKLAAGAADVAYIEDSQKNFQGFLSDFNEFAGEVFPYPLALARFFIWFVWGSQPSLVVDRPLESGELIDVGREVETVALPGHTTGHVGYLVRDAGVLALGDLIDFENSKGMDLNNPRSDFGAAVQSLERVLALEPEVIIPGHGAPTVGRAEVRDLLERALEGGRGYPSRILASLGTRPLRLGEITSRVFPDVPFSMEAMTRMLVLVVLLHMERRGQTRRSSGAGAPRWIRED